MFPTVSFCSFICRTLSTSLILVSSQVKLKISRFLPFFVKPVFIICISNFILIFVNPTKHNRMCKAFHYGIEVTKIHQWARIGKTWMTVKLLPHKWNLNWMWCSQKLLWPQNNRFTQVKTEIFIKLKNFKLPKNNKQHRNDTIFK